MRRAILGLVLVAGLAFVGPSAAGPQEGRDTATDAKPAAKGEPDDLSRMVAALVGANEKALPPLPRVDAKRADLARQIVEVSRWREHFAREALSSENEDASATFASLSPQLRRAILAVMDASFVPEPAVVFFENKLAATLDTEILEAGLQWERSSVGLRMSALSLENQAPGNRDAHREFIRQFLQKPVVRDEQRVRNCAQVDVLSNASEALLPFLETLVAAGAVAGATEQSQQVDMDKLAMVIAQAKPLLRDMARQAMLASCVFVYRNLSNAEFEEFLAFLRKDSGGRYARGSTAALRDTLLQRAEIFTRTLMQVLPQIKKQPTA